MKAYKVRWENYEDGDILGEFGLLNEAVIVNAISPEQALDIVKPIVYHSNDHFDVKETNSKHFPRYGY